MPSEIATTTHNYNYINKSRSKTKKRTMGGFRRPWNSTSMSSTTRTSNTITGKSTTKSPSSKPLLSSPAESSSSSSSSDNGNGGAGRLQMMTAMIIPPSPLAGNSNHRRVHPAATAGNSHSYTAKKDCLPSPLQTEEEEEEQPAAVTPVSSASSSNSFSDYHSPTTSSSGAPAPLLSATPKNKNTETQSHDTEQKDTEQKDTGTVTPTADKQQQEQDLSTTPKSQSTTASRTTTTSTSTSCSKALEFSAKACDCLAEQDWIAALHFYQQALDIYEAAAQQPLSIVDACNAASTLHNMAAVYRVLKDHPEESLSNYHDAEQLYRECYQRILLDTTNNAKSISTLSEEQLEEHEDTVCLPSLVAETLQHRATIYETSSVWDTVAALECHEACIEWLLQCQPKPNNNIQVTCLEDIYFLRTCTRDNHMELLTNSYKALAKLYRNTDSPQDGLQALLAWKQVVEEYLQQQKDNNNNNNKWHKNLVECYKMLSEYYLAQKDTTNAMKTLQSALDMQLQMQRHNKHKKSNSKSKRKEAGPAADAVLSPELMQQMNALGQAQEESGEYEEALQCYEKILLLTSQYLGEDHWEVAETLVKIGRVMEQQGNLAGGLDLYQAAHTIYQAAIKKDSGGENNTSHIVLEVDDDYDYEQALNTRAATESVVRIANVLMSQKRWQEAVDFLRELPQAKEWLAWLDDCNKEEDANTIASIKSKKGHVVQNNNKSNDGAAPAKPSVDQAIVFRELGRAYLGMGSLAKAKQCLLESARRLEGTDHEEDVFELLMHVEFCQKEEEKESRGRRRRSRSRSVSRARSRSRHNRSNSAGSSSEETARVVAAVLSPPSSGTVSSNAQDKMKSPDKGTGTPTPDSETHPHEPSSSIRDRPTEEEDDDDGVADPIDTSDSKSLGSLDTESGGEETDKESRQNSFENGKDTVDRSNHKWHFKDSYDVERARNIVLKRVTQQQEYWGAVKDDDNDLESDVVSALVGINIDVDSPPSSPESRRVEDHPELPSAKSSVSDRPFDEAILSQCSSRERHTEDLSTLRYKLNIGNLSQQGAARNYPYMVQEHMMLGRSGSDPRSGMNAVFGENLSDLTPSFGQSSSSSLSEVLARTKIANIPPLLERRGSIGDPTSPRSPSRMEQSIGGRSHTSPINSKTQKNGRSEKARISIQEQSMQPPQDHDDDNVESQEEGDRSYGDDESSDPFEGYEDFDMNEASNDDVSSNYGGDSESKGYTRFSREDFLSESNDCSSEADFDAGVESEHVVGITHSDVRETPSVSTSNCDDSPVPSPVSSNTEVDRQGEKKSKTLPSASSGAISPTPSAMRKPDNLGVSSSARSLFESSRESPSTTPTPKKEAIEQGDRFHDMQALNLPGNRIVKALSHYSELRLRRRQNRRFHALDTCKEDNEEGGEGQAAATKQQTTNSSLQLDCLNEFDEDHDVVGPIPFISMRSPSQEDDVVSQITFAHDDYTASNANKKSSHWWGPFGGLTAGKLDSWFQNNYLNQAVEAAEGFLSANVIHAQMKSKPLDFEPDEDDKDEDDNDVVDTQIVGKTEIIESTSIPGAQEIVMACSPIPSDMLYAPTNNALEAPLSPGGRSINSNRSKQSLKASTSSAEHPKPNAERSLALVPSASHADHKPNDSAGNSALAKEILRYEELLSQYEAEASKRNKTSPKVAGTLFRLAVLYIQNDDVQKALKATKDTSRMQKSLGDLADTSRSLHLLADIYVRKGEYDAALTCYTEVQGIEYQLYGYIHEETANTLNRIGSVLARKGDFDAAIEKHKEALTILKEYHGEELRHPLVSQTLIHIGAVYYRERNSLATVRKKNDSYSTFIEAGMLEVIGRAHEDRGSYKMAIAFFEEKLQCLNLNWNDPKSATTTAELDDISTTLNSLGMLSCRAGFYMEAIDYYDRALEVQKMVGCDKMHLATAKVLTATVQFQLGYFQKALSLLQEALKELQAITGKNHETVAATWFQIGVVRVALCDYDDAMDAFEEALRIQTKLLGKHHPATLRTRREIGNMYAIYESELEAAFIQFHDILENQKRIHGQKHPNVAETLHSLGCAYARKGEYRKAIKVLEECYYMRLDFLGSDHPLQASTLYEIAHIHIKRERFKKAVHICNAILEIRRESLSEQHIDLARALATRGSCLVVTGDYNEALKCFEEAFLVAKKAVGNTHPAVADIHILFAAMHLRKCNFDEAKGEITKALAIYQNSNLDGDHPSLKDAVALMERVERDEMLCV